jgi:hypothetical protein
MAGTLLYTNINLETQSQAVEVVLAKRKGAHMIILNISFDIQAMQKQGSDSIPARCPAPNHV